MKHNFQSKLICTFVGVVLASIGVATVLTNDSPTFHPARDAELHAISDAYYRTGVLLIKEKGTGSYYTQIESEMRWVPAAWDDDPGSYLIGAIGTRDFKFQSPYVSLKITQAILVGAGLFLLPFLVLAIFGQLASVMALLFLIPIVALAKGVKGIIGTDYLMEEPGGIQVYAQYGIPSSLIFLELMLVTYIFATRRTYRWRYLMIWSAVLGCLAGTSNLLRSWSGLGVAISVPLLVLFFEQNRKVTKIIGSGLIAVLCMQLAQSSVMNVINERRSAITNIESHSLPVAHGTWHPLYLGLGYIGLKDNYQEPNPLGVKWQDEFAWEKAREVDPNVNPNTSEYDQIIKTLFIEKITIHTKLAISTYAQKFIEVIKDNLVSLLFLIALLCASLSRRWHRSLSVAIVATLPVAVYGLMPPILVMPLRFYYVEFTAAIGFLTAISVAAAFEIHQNSHDLVKTNTN